MKNLGIINLKKFFSKENFTKAKTIYLKNLAFEIHKFYKGKIQVLPKAPLWDEEFFNLYYTPGVSCISTSIRDNNNLSFDLSLRGNSVAVVSDSTRVLGDGDCTPSGGLGVMEGKAYLMKYLGGIDAFPLCIDSKDKNGNPSGQKIIDFVKMVSPSFGAINLEDISQPNCYIVLDKLREECHIPVWHDDAQGTACVILASLINALKVVNKKMENIKVVLYGAGAANSMVAEFICKAGVKAKNIIMFDINGTLHKNRLDLKDNKDFYKQWNLCQKTNPDCILSPNEAMKKADVIIALSKADASTIKPEWIFSMNDKAIVFACANPIPEIYPEVALKAGAHIVATGRGDFPNQINNSLGFPGILKGVLLSKAKKITDEMAIAASYAIANHVKNPSANNIMPKMSEALTLFPKVAKEVAKIALEQNISKANLDICEVEKIAYKDIFFSQKMSKILMKSAAKPPKILFENALAKTIEMIKK